MPNKTLYIRNEDIEVWAKIEVLVPSGDVSPLVSKLLRQYLEQSKLELGEMSRITVTIRDNESTPATAKSFIGRWIIPMTMPLAIGAIRYALALTSKEQLAVYAWDTNSTIKYLGVYRNIDDLKLGRKAVLPYRSSESCKLGGPLPDSVITELDKRLKSSYIENLDI